MDRDEQIMKSATPVRALRVLVLLCGLFVSARVSAQCYAAFSYNINRTSKIVNFYSHSTNTGSYNHMWVFGDSTITTSILANPVRTFPRYGTYYVTHVVSNGICSDSVGFYVTIDSVEATCKAAFTPFINHNNGQVSFNNTSTGGATGFYFWKMGYGADTNVFNPIRKYPNGSYYVCMTKANGSCIDSLCQSLDIGCSVGFSWKQDTVNGIIHFTNLSAQGPDMTYKWTFGDLIGGSSTLLDPSYHYMYNGKYYVCLTVTRGNGYCSATFCDTVEVDYPSHLCKPHISYTRDTTDKRKYSFSGFVGPEPANSYHWNFGDNNSSSLQNVEHRYADTGSYQVCLTSRRFDGCISTTCETLAVYPDSNAACASRFTFKTRSDTTDQDGVRRSLLFYNQSSGAKNQVWLFGDNTSSSNEVEPAHHYAADGEYPVCLIVFDSALTCSDTQCVVVRIGKDSGCVASFSYQLFADSVGGTERIVIFHDESKGPGVAYEWTFNDSTFSDERHPYHYFAENGQYKICLLIRNPGDDCFDSTCRNIKIGFSSGLHRYTSTWKNLQIYPVPFRDVVNLDFNSERSGAAEVKLVNMLGKVEKHEQVPIVNGDNKIELRTEMLKSGVYFIELNSGDEKITRKIVK